jgi:glycosyltransferase involved in cell wall biosynthesis
MQIAMLCTKYTLTSGDEYLTNELAAAIASQGHRVQVVVLDWSAPSGGRPQQVRVGDVDVMVLAPCALEGFGRLGAVASKWVLSSLRATLQMRPALRGRHFDLLIAFSPISAMAGQVLWLARRFRTRNYLVMWDFFPYHHRSIGLIPDGWPFAIARRLEQSLIRRFDIIGCMSPRNVAYLRDHYALRPNQRAEILPIWGRIDTQPMMSREHARTAFGLPHDKTIIVHGGQITEGRGIDDILAAAAIARREHPRLSFLLIGEGRLTGAVNAHIAEGGDNVIYRPRISRQEYLSVVSACDVGIVCTVRNVDVPTFPSKIIDYLRAGLPVVASVENSTDYGQFIEENGIGLAVSAGDPCALVSGICSIAHNTIARKRMIEAGRRVLAECFNVQSVAARLLRSLPPLPSDVVVPGPAA